MEINLGKILLTSLLRHDLHFDFDFLVHSNRLFRNFADFMSCNRIISCTEFID